jgi:hypothetical protein
MVGSSAKVRENAVVDQSARVFYTSDISGNALVTGSAIVYSTAVSGTAIVKDAAWLNDAIISGTAIVGGDAENFGSVSAGTYLQDYGLRDGDGLTSHYLNADVNPTIDEYTALPMVNTTGTGFRYLTDPVGNALLMSADELSTVTFFNLSGVKVCQISFTGNYTLPISQVGKPGMYVMLVVSGNERQTHKLAIGR